MKAFKVVAGLFDRSAKTKNDKYGHPAFKFSEALDETGRYKLELNHYQPLQLAGDPELMEYLPVKQANNVCNQLLYQVEERAENARTFLKNHELYPEDDLIDYWKQVEDWLPALCEQSKEPAHQSMDDIRRPLRPMTQVFLYDLAFAYAQSALKLYPELRLSCAGENIVPFNARGLPAFPVILNSKDKVLLYPCSVLQWVGMKAMAGQQTDVLAMGLETLQGISENDSPQKLIAQWVEAHYKRKGSLPTLEELGEYVMDNGWHADEVPSELIDRIEATEVKLAD